ncbi:MAG: hypothetical protein N2C13_01415, partial [Chloroflexota bacterium]
IPTHILTTNMRYTADYRRAGIQTFPSVYGLRVTRRVKAISSAGAAIAISVAAFGIGITAGCFHLLTALTFGLLLLAMYGLLKPSEKTNFGLFKYASVYMLSAMVLLAVGVF